MGTSSVLLLERSAQIPRSLTRHKWRAIHIGVIILSLVVAVLTTGSSAVAAGDSACVRVLTRGDDVYQVALGSGCDLRSVARSLPQRDGGTGEVLSMQDQLRSIYAYNQQLSAKDASVPRTVLRGCVPAKAPPSDATREERDACPRGVVNYYGIASARSNAVIYVPRSRTATLSERLETLGNKTCGVLAGVRGAYGEGAAVPSSVEGALGDCERQLAGGFAPIAMEAPPPPVAAAPTSTSTLNAMTPDAAVFDRRIRELEQGRELLIAAAGRQRYQANLWIGILGASVLLLLGWNVVMWRRARRHSSTSAAAAQQTEHAAQAVESLKKELKSKLATASKSNGGQLREQIAAMHAVEQEYEEAIGQVRAKMQQQLTERDRAISDLERTARALAQRTRQAQSRATKSEKQLEKLRARLRLAKTGSLGVSDGSGHTLLPIG